MKQEKKNFYKANWFLWMWLILFPPIGLVLLWVFHRGMNKNTRIIITVIFAIWFVFLMASTESDSLQHQQQKLIHRPM